MSRISFSLVCILTATALMAACSSDNGEGGKPHGPCVGGLVLDGRDAAKLSGELQANGALDITMHGSVDMQTHAQLSGDFSFSSSATAQGYTIQYSGKVEWQAGAQHKFTIAGTFTATAGARSTTGTFSLRSLDCEVLDGLKTQVGASAYGLSGLAQLTFADDTLGFAALEATTTNSPSPGALGPTYTTYVWKTDDAGRTWNPMGSLPEQVIAMTFAGQRLWISTGTGLWSSSDQGQSFVPIINGIAELNNQYGGFGNDAVLVDFFDADHGALLSPSQAQVWITQDGGKSWKASGPLINGGVWPFGNSSSVQMLSASEAVALITPDTGAGPALLRTSDAGATWQGVNRAVAPTALTDSSLFCSGTITAVRFVDSKRGWGLGQCLATTADGGLTWTWTGQYAPCNGDGGLYPVSATQAIVSCASGNLYVTYNGGAAFQAVPDLPGVVTGMRIFADGSGLLVAGGTALTTADSGATWTYLTKVSSNVTAISPVSSTEWWGWSPVGLQHAQLGGETIELAVLAVPLVKLDVTADTLWGQTATPTWLALPLAGGAPQVVEASTSMWPLSRTTLVAQLDVAPYPGGSPEPAAGLSLSVDGGLTWTSLAGLSSGDTSTWNGCVADATHAWFEKRGSFYLLDNDSAQLVLSAQEGDSAGLPLFCDVSHFWFLDNSVPKMLSDGAIVAQTVPLEWDESGAVDSVLGATRAASAISDRAAWLLLWDGRLLHFMDDAAYGTYQGPAVVGTAPTSTTTGTGTSSNRPPNLAPITGIATYNYDMNGNYMGGLIQLSTYAGDPDGDPVTITWTVEASSGGPTLASATGNNNILVLDSISYGTVHATASDGKGGTATQSFEFGRPEGT